MRNFLYEMVLSNNRAADNDDNAAVDDVRVALPSAQPTMMMDWTEKAVMRMATG